MKYKKYSDEIWQKIRHALTEELRHNPNPVAAFDADGTLWDTDLGESFFQYQIQHKVLSGLPQDPWRHYRDWKESGDPRPAYLWLAQINAGHKLTEVQGWAEKAVQSKEPLPIFEEQKKLIELLLKSNVQVWIVTASVKWAVEPGALRLGLTHKNVIGIETQVENGLVTDIQAGSITYREGKPATLLEKTKGVRPFLCAGNSLGDFALLESATRIQLAVGAATREHELFSAEEKLREAAKQKNWIIHQF